MWMTLPPINVSNRRSLPADNNSAPRSGQQAQKSDVPQYTNDLYQATGISSYELNRVREYIR
jgi:hypothetical protein